MLNEEDELVKEINEELDKEILDDVKDHYLTVENTKNKPQFKNSSTFKPIKLDAPRVSHTIAEGFQTTKINDSLNFFSRKVALS